jgi:hypothetical protein
LNSLLVFWDLIKETKEFFPLLIPLTLVKHRKHGQYWSLGWNSVVELAQQVQGPGFHSQHHKNNKKPQHNTKQDYIGNQK